MGVEEGGIREVKRIGRRGEKGNGLILVKLAGGKRR